MIRRPPRSTLDRSSAASDVYKRQARTKAMKKNILEELPGIGPVTRKNLLKLAGSVDAVSYTHLRAHETVLDLVCRLLLEKKNTNTNTESRQCQTRNYTQQLTDNSNTHMT